MPKRVVIEPREVRNRPEQWDSDGVRAIWAAASVKTITDYRAAMHRKDRKASALIRECEEFFDSDAFGYLTNGLGAKDVRALVEKEMKDHAGTGDRDTYRTMAV